MGISIGGAAGKAAVDSTGSVIATTVGDIVGKTIDKAADVLPAILQAYHYGKQKDLEIAALGASQPVPVNPRRPWEAAAPGTAPAPAPAVAPHPQPQAQSLNTQPPGPMTPITLFTKYRGALTEFFPFIKDHYQNFDGVELRDLLYHRLGANFMNQFRQDATPELLAGLVKMDPALNAIFQPADKVQQFFEDLLSDPAADPEDDEDEEGQVIGADNAA